MEKIYKGYHVYKDPLIGKQLSCREDRHDVHDIYAMAVVQGDAVVGHVL